MSAEIMEKMIISVPEILLPKEGTDLSKWACIACDQFTSAPQYWAALEAYVANSPSTLRITYPEVYLGEVEEAGKARIASINATMQEYLKTVLTRSVNGFVLTVRTLPLHGVRCGIVLAVDLEEYSFVEKTAKIRATEGTILERIPPRVRIRKNAALELPHIMLLIDDREKSVIEPLFEKKDEMPCLYDFELNAGGGHIAGYQISDSDEVTEKLMHLLDEKLQSARYGHNTGFLFAVGDGNHSLATAKQCWEDLKPTLSPEEQKTHPARYALCEVVNLHADSLVFEPIHRLVTGVDAEGFVSFLKENLNGEGNLLIETGKGEESISAPIGAVDLLNAVQGLIDTWIQKHGGTCDYVHEEETLKNVVRAREDAVALYMKPIEKEDFFSDIVKNGVLPRKTFSMGVAEEKRYYLEARKVKNI